VVTGLSDPPGALEPPRSGRAPTPARGRREVALGLGVFAVYAVVAATVGDRNGSAERHGQDILDVERAMHLAAEEPLNAWLAPHRVLSTVANYEYAYGYLVTAAALLIWLYLRRPDEYRWARTLFLVLNGIGIACFALYPVTPPRLLPDAGFVDTVRAGHTFGSWGSPMLDPANHVAAMPSLHVAWGVFVVTVLICVSSPRWLWLAAAGHVAITTLVIMATANHYLLDAVGGAVAVALAYGLVAWATDRPGVVAPRIAAADAFFLYAESAAAPQHVCGLIVMRDTPGGTPYADRLRARMESNLARLPRLLQRPSAPSRWRRPRWVPADGLDWAWHLPVVDLAGPDGQPAGPAALRALVAEVQAARLPRDRPLWRVITVTGVAEGEPAALLVVHHAVGDATGVLDIASGLLDPAPVWRSGGSTEPGALRRAIGVATGLVQLAGEGTRPPRLPSGPAPTRRVGTSAVPLGTVRRVAAAHGVHVSDVLLSAVAGAARRVLPGSATRRGLRVSVPLTMRPPAGGQLGNVTAGVMVDLPLAPMREVERLAETNRRTRRLRSGSRAFAARFVVATAIGVLPAPVQAWFARTVYGHRFFQAIVSNMPGPVGSYRFAGAPVRQVYPIVPLAEGAPLAVGVLGWDSDLFVGVSVDPTLVEDADRLAAEVRAVVDELAQTAASGRPEPGQAAPAGQASAEAR
jgi:hypothetical protein